MNTSSRESRVAIGVTLLFLLAMGFAIFYFSDGRNLKKDLTSEKVKSEKMLSEKLALSKELDKLKNEIDSYKGKNASLDKSLADLKSKLQKKEAEFNRMAANSSPNYKKQFQELQAIKADLDKTLARLNEELSALQSENNDLRTSLAMMEANNEQLAVNNKNLTRMIVNNLEAEAQKKNNKLTVNAKKTKEIILAFEVPASMSEQLKFNIVFPDGKQVASNNSKNITYAVNHKDFVFSDAEVVASTQNLFVKSDDSKQIALSYKADSKLKPGTYQIDIYSENEYLGSCRMKLK
tara:strand:- start:8187 stop:9065 length:879 start_codon:yes stop_codon:yes gene_type:complete